MNQDVILELARELLSSTLDPYITFSYERGKIEHVTIRGTQRRFNGEIIIDDKTTIKKLISIIYWENENQECKK